MSVIKIRKPTEPFEVIDKASIESIRDPVALAIWVFLRAKPEGWVVRESHVRDHFNLGRDKYRSSIKYLCLSGATEDVRLKDDRGRIVGRELIVNHAVRPDWISAHRAPENPAHGVLVRAPENPAHGEEQEENIENSSCYDELIKKCAMSLKNPSDGESAPLLNTKRTLSTEKRGSGQPDPIPPEPKNNTETNKNRFAKPTPEEVNKYCIERGNGITGQYFCDFYESKGWLIGKSRTPMKDWKAAVRTWEEMNKKNRDAQPTTNTSARGGWK